MKIDTLHVIEFPNGKFGYVGKVPVEIAYINPTQQELDNLQFGERFGPKKRTFTTADEAEQFAVSQGYKIA